MTCVCRSCVLTKKRGLVCASNQTLAELDATKELFGSIPSSKLIRKRTMPQGSRAAVDVCFGGQSESLAPQPKRQHDNQNVHVPKLSLSLSEAK